MMKRMNDLVPLSEVFDILHGNKFDLNKMERCSAEEGVTFVGRSSAKGGIVGFVKRLVDIEPYTAGLITVALGGSALSSFVQPWPFYTAQNIDVLRPRVEMSLDVKMFYCLCVEANRFRYSTFGREANRTLRTLLVPNRDSVPPWVKGAAEKAVSGLIRDLKAVI
ncbi:MAG TPA: hypothetical protein VGS07_16435 [Thermoanaerobaculia bacterium]|jgi:hypothetical protein|nr:hypothetical protein [Thermoanaerobaculia bacterium]